MRKTRRSSFPDAPALARGAGRLLGCLFILSAGALAGCGAACDTSDDGNPPDRYTGGTTAGDVYESSLLKSGLLPFPGGKQYQLVHHLGFTPAIYQVFLAFSPDGERVAPCAGNECVIRCVDDEIIWLKNDTCAEFWVRVVAADRSSESRGAACTSGGIGPLLDASSNVDADAAAQSDASGDAALD
jgi:hypothetical protein